MGGGEASFDPGPMMPGGGPRKLGNGGGRTGAVLMVDRRKEGSRGIPSSPGPIFSRSPKMGGKAVPCIPGELDLVDVIGVLYGEPEDMGGAELNAEKGRLADEDELDGENAERSCESENADRSDAGGVAASSALARVGGMRDTHECGQSAKGCPVTRGNHHHRGIFRQPSTATTPLTRTIRGTCDSWSDATPDRATSRAVGAVRTCTQGLRSGLVDAWMTCLLARSAEDQADQASMR